jgi:hypothetical protein
MQPVISPELLRGVVEIVLYAFTLLTAVWSYLVTARA